MKSIIMDAHQDAIQYKYFANKNGQSSVQTNIDDLKNNHVRLVAASIWIPDEVILADDNPIKNSRRFVTEQLKTLMELITEGPRGYIVRRAEDFDAMTQNENVWFLLHVEGIDFVRQIEAISYWYNLGIRSTGLVWMRQNLIATPVNIDSKTGLSAFGRLAVRELQNHGIAVDLAHINPVGFYDVLGLAKKPVIFSHGNCRRFRNHPRNLTDDQMKALALSGGLFGLSCHPGFVRASGRVTPSDLFRHFDHALEIMGSNAVCLGSDFGGIFGRRRIRQLTGVHQIENLLELFDKKGFTAEQIEQIAWKNLFHFYQSVL